MPNDQPINLQKEILSLAQAVETCVETAALFGEEDFAFVPESAKPRVIATPQQVQMSASLDKAARLEALYAQYSGCQNCKLGATRTKIVFGKGALDPKVLFIGEGPGFEEDRQGLPFVGKAGQLLDKIMASIGLDLTNAHIVNIVKCHPMKDPTQPDMRGNDRPPEPEETAACSPILARQIEILNPSVICALGSPSAKFLLNTSEGITRLRGRWFEFTSPESGKTIPLLPTYHPAALLRNEELKKDVWEDMKKLRDFLSGKKPA